MTFDLQAEELVKKEMLTMLHHDALYTPSPNQLGVVPGNKKQSQKGVINQAQHAAFLEEHPYEKVDEVDLEEVCIMWMNV